MYKRLISLIVLFPVIFSGLRASDSGNKFSISIAPAGILSCGGNYSDQYKLRQVVNVGVGLEPRLRYKINENMYLGAGYAFKWMSVKDGYEPYAYKENSPSFIMQSLTLNGTFYLMSGYVIEPYFSLGVGLYPWKFSGSILGGETWSAPGNPEESFSDTSIGLNIGLGIEMFAWKHFSIMGEVKYIYVFAKNEAKFATDDFTEQDFIGVNIGIIYYFGK